MRACLGILRALCAGIVVGLLTTGCLLPPAAVDEGPPRGAAADQCDLVVGRLCTKLAPCEGVSPSTCVSQTNQTFQQQFGEPCSGADSVSASYNTCLAELDQLSDCSAGAPASCSGVVLFNQ